MMKLGKRMKVFPLPKMQIELFNQFVPGVKEELRNVIDYVKVELKFVEHMARVDGMRYNLSVSITKPMTAIDMIELAKRLDQYCSNNEEPYQAADGRYYTLGDGDDSGAVMFEDGEFSIWLRGWPTSDL